MQLAINASTKMTVASRAVMMAVMTEVRMTGMMIDVEQEGHTSHRLSTMV